MKVKEKKKRRKKKEKEKKKKEVEKTPSPLYFLLLQTALKQVGLSHRGAIQQRQYFIRF